MMHVSWTFVIAYVVLSFLFDVFNNSEVLKRTPKRTNRSPIVVKDFNIPEQKYKKLAQDELDAYHSSDEYLSKFMPKV